MAGVSHDRDVVPALSPDLLANLGVVLGCGPIVVHGEVGAGTTRGDTYTFVVPPGVVASDATLRALIAAARQQSSTVTSLAAAELAIVPAGLDVLAAIDVHACGGEAMGDVEQTAPAALLAPGTAFDVRDGEVVWQGPGVRVPDARVATRATSFRTGPMTGAARPVFRRALVVAVVAAPWTQRLIDWVAAHRGDRSLALRVLGPAEGSPPDCAPADDLGSLVELRPDVVIADIDHVPAGLGDALAPLSRTVVVTVDDGAACVSRDPGGRVRGTLGVDLDRDATVAALARWASGPSVGGPVIISPDVPGGSHVRHPMPRLAAPVRTVGLHANGGHSHDRFVALAAACSGMPDLATSVVPLESDRLPDVLFVGGPLGPALDEVAGAVRAGVGVALDLYGTDASADLAKLPSDVRRRLLLLTPGHATRRRLAQAFGVPVHVLPAVSTGQDPLPVGSGGTLVLGVATGTDVNERALAACAARAAAPVDFIGAPGPAAWTALPPAPRQLAADADLVVVVGAGLDGVALDTIALAARTGSVVVGQSSDELHDLVDPRGLVIVDDDWEDAITRARESIERGAGADVQSAARAWTGAQATRARVRRAVDVAMGRAAR